MAELILGAALILVLLITFGLCHYAEARCGGQGLRCLGSFALGVLALAIFLAGAGRFRFGRNFDYLHDKQQGGTDYHVGWSDQVEIREEGYDRASARRRRVITFRGQAEAEKLLARIDRAIREGP